MHGDVERLGGLGADQLDTTPERGAPPRRHLHRHVVQVALVDRDRGVAVLALERDARRVQRSESEGRRIGAKCRTARPGCYPVATRLLPVALSQPPRLAKRKWS